MTSGQYAGKNIEKHVSQVTHELEQASNYHYYGDPRGRIHPQPQPRINRNQMDFERHNNDTRANTRENTPENSIIEL